MVFVQATAISRTGEAPGVSRVRGFRMSMLTLASRRIVYENIKKREKRKDVE